MASEFGKKTNNIFIKAAKVIYIWDSPRLAESVGEEHKFNVEAPIYCLVKWAASQPHNTLLGTANLSVTVLFNSSLFFSTNDSAMEKALIAVLFSGHYYNLTQTLPPLRLFFQDLIILPVQLSLGCTPTFAYSILDITEISFPQISHHPFNEFLQIVGIPSLSVDRLNGATLSSVQKYPPTPCCIWDKE